jgi:hypothetical protein
VRSNAACPSGQRSCWCQRIIPKRASTPRHSLSTSGIAKVHVILIHNVSFRVQTRVSWLPGISVGPLVVLVTTTAAARPTGATWGTLAAAPGTAPCPPGRQDRRPPSPPSPPCPCHGFAASRPSRRTPAPSRHARRAFPPAGRCPPAPDDEIGVRKKNSATYTDSPYILARS